MADMPDKNDDTQERGMDARRLISQYQRMRRRGSLLVLAALIVAVLLVSLLALLQPPPAQPDMSRLGIHLLLDDGRQQWPTELWPLHIEEAARVTAPGAIAVQLVRADDLDPQRWQQFLDLCEQFDLTPVLRMATTWDVQQQAWLAPVPDSDGTYASVARAYADFIAALDWPTVPHIILLNEPNRGDEWGGQPDAAAYARFLVESSAAIRASTPDLRILNAALDLYAPNTGGQPFADGFVYQDAGSYLTAMLAAEPDLFEHVDIWNSHAYPQGFTQPPWEQRYQVDLLNAAQSDLVLPPAGTNNRGVNGYEWELWLLDQLGVEAPPVMITEMGYRYAVEDSPAEDNPAEDGTAHAYPDAAAAAALLDMALRGNPARYPNAPRTGWTPLLADARVIAVAPFALNGHPAEWASTSWLRLDAAGQILNTTALFDVVAGFELRPQEQE